MGDRRKCQTYTASPAEPGGLPVMLVEAVPPRPKKPSAPAALRKLVRGACQRPDRDPFGQFGLVNRVELSLDGTFMRLLR
jgi:hypothetical protein